MKQENITLLMKTEQLYYINSLKQFKMKHIFKLLLCIGCITLPFVSCIKDEGNYTYTAPEVPQIVIDEVYDIYVGERLLIEPKVTFSNPDLLSFEWTIIDMEQMTSYTYIEPVLDIFFSLKPKLYMSRLTVTDLSNQMKYFYPFSIYGHTDFNEGMVLLTSKQGIAQLSFVKPDGTVIENLYEQMHGESLPSGPLQIVPLQHMNMMGRPYLGYWLLCSDKNNPGVLIDSENLSHIRYFRENFFSIPTGEISVLGFMKRDDATMAGIINGKYYPGAFETYYLSPIYGFFGGPVQGNYTLGPALASDPSGTFVWSYDVSKRSLACFIPPARMYFDATHMPGPPPAFDPGNLALDLVTLLSFNSGFYFFGKDDNGMIQELKFSTGGQMVISIYKRPFQFSEYVKADTKWVLLPGLEVFYFTSGDAIYRYNPLNETIEKLDFQPSGKVTMLKFKSSEQLIAGSEGKVYFLDISVGHRGEIIKTIEGFSGEPADVFERFDEI